MTLLDAVRMELAQLERAGRIRQPRLVEGRQGPVLRVDGKTVVCFCSNNYLGLADHPDLIAAAKASLDREGLGAAASRLISGSMEPHRQAEDRLARFVGAEAALLFATGFAANIGSIPALAGEQGVLFSDALNHASLIDGCRLSRAPVHVYPHRDLEALEKLLARHRASARRALIVTETLFSMDGDCAPIAGLRALADRYDAALMVDEAHALGVLGPQGRGLCAAAGVQPDVLIGTLGKSFGAAGAFVAGPRPVVQLLYNMARSFVFSTAPPPSVAAAAAAAVDLVEAAEDRRARLRDHTRRLRAGMAGHGLRPSRTDTPIIPLVVGSERAAMDLSAGLFARGLFVQGIRPPTVPAGTSRLRIVPTAAHERSHVEALLGALDDLLPRREAPT